MRNSKEDDQMKNMTKSILAKSIIGSVATLSLAFSAQGQSLFQEVPLTSEFVSEVATLEGATQSRQVFLNHDAMSQVFDKTSPADHVQLDLFPGRSVTLDKSGFDPFMGGGTRLWSGTIGGFEDGHATLIMDNNRLLGQIQYNGEIFRISPNAMGMHTIQEIAPESAPIEEANDFITVPPSQAAQQKTGNGFASLKSLVFPTRIRVLVMHTPAAKTEALAAGTTIRDEGLLALGMANTALTNSKMAVYKFKWAGLRGFGSCSYPEPSSTSTVLFDVTPWRPEVDTCVSPHAVAQRDALSADMVAVIKGAGGCGTAWYSSNGVSSNSTFSVTARGCIFQHTFTHELGHNQGLTHDRFTTGDVGTNQTAYNFGKAHWDAATPFRTIMAYSNECSANGVSCSRAPVYTNTHPGGMWNGILTGRGLHLSDPAVSRKKLKETWETIAAYR